MDIEKQQDFIIEKIVQTRHRKALSQLDLAQKADLSQSFLANLESGKKQPSVLTLLKIAKALEVDPGELFPKTIKSKAQIKDEIISLIEDL